MSEKFQNDYASLYYIQCDQQCFHNVFRVFQRCFMGICRVICVCFQGVLQGVSKVLIRYLKVCFFLTMYPGYTLGLLWGCQGCFVEGIKYEKVIQGLSNPRVIPMVFQLCLRIVPSRSCSTSNIQFSLKICLITILINCCLSL